jgi:2-polyprenyl-3-methyl-5-hydroxy-6-metoxy-1,4-benzoquinol methylase
MKVANNPFPNISDVRWRKALHFILVEHPLNVLDLGCGAGNISSALLKHDIKVFGMDMDIAKLKEARIKGIFATQANLMGSLPVKSKCFDVVFAGEIIEHLIDTDYFLEEIHRVLKRSGKLILTTPNLCNIENRLRILIGRYPIFVDYTCRGDNHLRVYNKRAIVRQIRERNFDIFQVTGSFVPPVSYSLLKNLSTRLMPMLGWLGDIFPCFALHVIVKARKIE